MAKFIRVGHIPSALLGLCIMALIFFISYEVQIYKEKNTHYLVCDCTYYNRGVAIIHHSTKAEECYELKDKHRTFIHSSTNCKEHRFEHPHWEDLKEGQCKVYFCNACMDEKGRTIFRDSTGIETNMPIWSLDKLSD